MVNWQLNEADKAIIAREVENFLPDHIFDAHAHLFRHDHFPPGMIGGFANTTQPARAR